jgi:hypothetical protein
MTTWEKQDNLIWGGGLRVDLYGPGHRSVESSCEHGNEPSSLMEDGEIRDSVNFLCYLQ